jgi:superfamily II DNA or RNA helicase
MDREHKAIDPSVPEAYFEQAFSDVYGRDKLNMIYREYPILDINGSTRWIDYVIFSNNGMVAIEKNGVRYHHPLIIGVKRYKDQLVKQNSIIAQGAKLYRWSLESMQFKDVFCEEIKAYLPQKEDIVETHHILAKRKFKLFDHQNDVLKNIQTDRLNGNNTFLVVLPTGTGKTHIIVSDYTKQYHKKSSCKMMVLVPTRKLKAQWIQYFKDKQISEGYSNNIGDSDSCNIMVQTYSWMSRHYHNYSPNMFDYIVIDEAHHAVAPTLKKIIQSFNPQTLIGLTATPERLDTKKLESIFGEYETNLTLKEAIELACYIRDLKYYPEQVQDFYPTPGTMSTCMFYTGLDPRTMEKVHVPRKKEDKAMQRALIQYKNPKNYNLVYKALTLGNRRDLIGYSKHCLIKPRP